MANQDSRSNSKSKQNQLPPELDTHNLAGLIHRINSVLPIDCGHNEQTGYVNELHEIQSTIYNELFNFMQNIDLNKIKETIYLTNQSNDLITNQSSFNLPTVGKEEGEHNNNTLPTEYNAAYDAYIPDEELPEIFKNLNSNEINRLSHNRNNKNKHKPRSKSKYLAKKLATSKRYDIELVQLLNSVLKLKQLLQYGVTELNKLEKSIVGMLNPHTQRCLSMLTNDDAAKVNDEPKLFRKSFTESRQLPSIRKRG